MVIPYPLVGYHQYLGNLMLGLGVEGTLFLWDLAPVTHMFIVSATEVTGPSRQHIILTLLSASPTPLTHISASYGACTLGGLQDTILSLCPDFQAGSKDWYSFGPPEMALLLGCAGLFLSLFTTQHWCSSDSSKDPRATETPRGSTWG